MEEKMGEKLIFCKACGKEMAKSAKTCPNCGKRNKKPFWITLVVLVGIVVVLSIIGKNSGEVSSPTKLSIPPKEEYVTLCQQYSYEEIARNPNAYKEKPSLFTGKVVQVLENGRNITLRLNVTKGQYMWSDTIWVDYIRSNEDESRILNDDVIKVYGNLNGIKSYKATLGNTINIPWLIAYYIER
jgi:RNA polymerase subunit RPABC4/transcription elongation factor Spt4